MESAQKDRFGRLEQGMMRGSVVTRVFGRQSKGGHIGSELGERTVRMKRGVAAVR